MGGAFSRGSSLGEERQLLSELFLPVAAAAAGICRHLKYPPQEGRLQVGREMADILADIVQYRPGRLLADKVAYFQADTNTRMDCWAKA
jgi:hypothetical protein